MPVYNFNFKITTGKNSDISVSCYSTKSIGSDIHFKGSSLVTDDRKLADFVEKIVKNALIDQANKHKI
jgi:hypothetical protein